MRVRRRECGGGRAGRWGQDAAGCRSRGGAEAAGGRARVAGLSSGVRPSRSPRRRPGAGTALGCSGRRCSASPRRAVRATVHLRARGLSTGLRSASSLPPFPATASQPRPRRPAGQGSPSPHRRGLGGAEARAGRAWGDDADNAGAWRFVGMLPAERLRERFADGRDCSSLPGRQGVPAERRAARGHRRVGRRDRRARRRRRGGLAGLLGRRRWPNLLQVRRRDKLQARSSAMCAWANRESDAPGPTLFPGERS